MEAGVSRVYTLCGCEMWVSKYLCFISWDCVGILLKYVEVLMDGLKFWVPKSIIIIVTE